MAFSIKQRNKKGQITGFVKVDEKNLFKMNYYNHWLFGYIRRAHCIKALENIQKITNDDDN